jgi:cysteinyl-tRNA synthetase
MREVADTYTTAFLDDLTALNIRKPSALPRASEHITADVALIETLMQKEYAYETSDGVYFDTARFEGYGKLGGIDVEKLQEGARVTRNEEKRNPSDFALWKKNPNLGWESPWGRGFPGWHIECSAMAMEYLGKELDIHTGGIDHIGTHHNNEIAQSEAATGRPFARFWMHNAHILVEGTKFSKSLGNTIQLRQLQSHGFSPLAYRYWLLTGHYRTPMSFSFIALEGAQTALRRLHRYFVEELPAQNGNKDEVYARRFLETINDDLDTPKAIALVWELVKDSTVTPGDKRATLLHFDKALGLGLNELVQSGKEQVSLEVATTDLSELPEEARVCVENREKARNEKNWQRADELRTELSAHGYEVLDTADGPKVRKNK